MKRHSTSKEPRIGVVAALALLVLSATISCKPRRSSSYGTKSAGGAGGCVSDVSNRTDTMGIRLEDAPANGGARVACVEPNLGLHVPYGLQAGDVIVALNRNTEVKSVAEFEDRVKTLEADFEEPIGAWEFTVDRNGQRLVLSAKPEWQGCIPESFNRCGSVVK